MVSNVGNRSSFSPPRMTHVSTVGMVDKEPATGPGPVKEFFELCRCGTTST